MRKILVWAAMAGLISGVTAARAQNLEHHDAPSPPHSRPQDSSKPSAPGGAHRPYRLRKGHGHAVSSRAAKAPAEDGPR